MTTLSLMLLSTMNWTLNMWWTNCSLPSLAHASFLPAARTRHRINLAKSVQSSAHWLQCKTTNKIDLSSTAQIRSGAKPPEAEWIHESRSLYAIAHPSVVYLSSVTFVRSTQAVQIFRNISTAFGTLAIHWHPHKILGRSSQGNTSARGVKHKRGSQI